MKKLAQYISVVIITFALVGLIYTTYLIAKTVSYNMFYEDMVKQTITEMIKDSALKERPNDRH